MSTWRDVDFIENRLADLGAAVAEVLDRARVVDVHPVVLFTFMSKAQSLTDIGREIKRAAETIVQKERGSRT